MHGVMHVNFVYFMMWVGEDGIAGPTRVIPRIMIRV